MERSLIQWSYEQPIVDGYYNNSIIYQDGSIDSPYIVNEYYISDIERTNTSGKLGHSIAETS